MWCAARVSLSQSEKTCDVLRTPNWKPSSSNQSVTTHPRRSNFAIQVDVCFLAATSSAPSGAAPSWICFGHDATSSRSTRATPSSRPA